MKVNLKIKKDNTVETIQHEVEELNILQVTRAIKTIKDVFSLAQKDENLKALLAEVFEEEGQEVSEQEGAEQVETVLSGRNIGKHLIGAMDVLLVEVPDKAFELISILSNIDYDTFMQQKAEDVFDIYDAVIQVNDIEKLVNRAKKSFELTKGQVKVMNLFNRNKATELKQA